MLHPGRGLVSNRDIDSRPFSRKPTALTSYMRGLEDCNTPRTGPTRCLDVWFHGGARCRSPQPMRNKRSLLDSQIHQTRPTPRRIVATTIQVLSSLPSRNSQPGYGRGIRGFNDLPPPSKIVMGSDRGFLIGGDVVGVDDVHSVSDRRFPLLVPRLNLSIVTMSVRRRSTDMYTRYINVPASASSIPT